MEGASLIQRFPDELLVQIFGYLEPKELRIAGQVCQQWRQVSRDDRFWAPYAEKFFVRPVNGTLGRRAMYMAALETIGLRLRRGDIATHIFSHKPLNSSPAIFALGGEVHCAFIQSWGKTLLVAHAFKFDTWRAIDIAPHRAMIVVPVIGKRSVRLAVGADASVLLLVSPETGDFEVVGKGAGSLIKAIAPVNDQLVAVADDNSIGLWNLQKKTCVGYFDCGDCSVIQLQCFAGRYLVARGDQGKLLLWDLRCQDPVARVLAGHTECTDTPFVQVPGRPTWMLGGSSPFRLTVWNLATRRPIRSHEWISFPRQELTSPVALWSKGALFVTAVLSSSRKIICWDGSGRGHAFGDGIHLMAPLGMKNQYLLTVGIPARHTQLWDVTAGKCIRQMPSCHQRGQTSLPTGISQEGVPFYIVCGEERVEVRAFTDINSARHAGPGVYTIYRTIVKQLV